MSELVVRHGCMLFGCDILARMPDTGEVTGKQFAEILIEAEGIEPYEIGTKDHVERLSMFETMIEQHFHGEPINVTEVREWATS